MPGSQSISALKFIQAPTLFVIREDTVVQLCAIGYCRSVDDSIQKLTYSVLIEFILDLKLFIQGSKNGRNWDDLLVHFDDTALGDPGSTATWPITPCDTNEKGYY